MPTFNNIAAEPEMTAIAGLRVRRHRIADERGKKGAGPLGASRDGEGTVALAGSAGTEDVDRAGAAAMRGRNVTTAPYRIVDAPSARAATNLPRGTRVVIGIAGIDPGVAARHQFRINVLLSECGCRLSAAALVACVSAAIAIDAVRWTAFRESPVAIVAAELLLAFLASGIGRFVGIANARKKLRIVLSSIADGIEDDQQRRRVSWAA